MRSKDGLDHVMGKARVPDCTGCTCVFGNGELYKRGSGDLTQLTECWPNMQDGTGFDPDTQETEAEGPL